MDKQKDNAITPPGSVLENVPINSIFAAFSELAGEHGSGEFSLRILKRTAKVVEALFLITNTFQKDEKIRDEIRSKGLLLLAEVLDFLKRRDETDRVALLSTLVLIATLLETAKVIGILNAHTVYIVESACVAIREQVISTGSMPKLPDIFKDEFNDRSLQQFASVSDQHILSNILKMSHTPGRAEILVQKDTKGQHTDKTLENRKFSQRQVAILDLVKEKQKVTVKDIQSVVRGYSQKTLQRELLSLVAEGVLKKEGERRWSTYALHVNGSVNGKLNSSF